MKKKYCKKEKIQERMKRGRGTGKLRWRPRGTGEREGEVGRQESRRKRKAWEKRKNRAEKREHSGRERLLL